VKIKVSTNVQLVHAGAVYGPGDTASVPDDVAQEWVRQGWATEIKSAPRKRKPR
jgi:hypothetical protein